MLSLCQWCGKQYETTKPKAKFCGLSCFGKANNHARASNLKGYIVPRLLTDPLLCQVCGKYLPQHGKKYCSNACQAGEKRKQLFEDVTASGIAPSNHHTLRRFMFDHFEHKCSICGLIDWCGKPAPLEVDHIDGNYENNALTNLRLVCGNCGMQLPTYKGKNKGKGRYTRRQRYAEGKSY